MRASALLAALLLLVACSPAGQGPSSAAAGSRHRGIDSYVALGDSYTAAPYVPLTDIADGCFRSDHNYPSLVAEALHVRHFRDVSCSAATTDDVTRRQRTAPSRGVSVPPQLDAVHRDTDLVTVGLGGNDFGISGLLLRSCPTARSSCLPASAVPRIRRSIAALRPRLATTLRLVRRAAPHATVLLVGYPKIAPDHGSCPQLPALTPEALAVLNRLNRDLDVSMAAAARDAGVGYVDVYRPSTGHDICARVPWVNGVRTDPHRAAGMHPFGIEQRAVARLVVAKLSR